MKARAATKAATKTATKAATRAALAAITAEILRCIADQRRADSVRYGLDE